MMEEKDQNRNKDTSQASSKTDWKELVDRFSYDGIVNNIHFMVFVAVLLLLYISNDQRAIQTQREINRKNDELKELRWKYMDVKSRLMSVGMEAEVIRKADKIGLKPMMMPAFRIEKDSLNK